MGLSAAAISGEGTDMALALTEKLSHLSSASTIRVACVPFMIVFLFDPMFDPTFGSMFGFMFGPMFGLMFASLFESLLESPLGWVPISGFRLAVLSLVFVGGFGVTCVTDAEDTVVPAGVGVLSGSARL